MIKNTKADITQALKQVKTQRRVALTGSPLQNNLMEYYCVSNSLLSIGALCMVLVFMFACMVIRFFFVKSRWLIL